MSVPLLHMYSNGTLIQALRAYPTNVYSNIYIWRLLPKPLVPKMSYIYIYIYIYMWQNTPTYEPQKIKIKIKTLIIG